jgi:hypothetical protein
MSVVDVQQWDQNMCHSHMHGKVHAVWDEYEDDIVHDFDIETIANLIGKPLIDGQFKYNRGKFDQARESLVQLTWTTAYHLYFCI